MTDLNDQETVRAALERVAHQCEVAEIERKRVCVLANERGVSYRSIAGLLGLKLSQVSKLIAGEVVRTPAVEPLDKPIGLEPQ